MAKNKNYGIYLNLDNKIISRYESSKKVNFIRTMLSHSFEKHSLGSQMQVLKWLDPKGNINIAFQVLRPHPLDTLHTLNTGPNKTSYSLVFSQNSLYNISIRILFTATHEIENETTEEHLGTYNLEELDEKLIIQKFEQFINSIAT
jgi:hypothetical protein